MHYRLFVILWSLWMGMGNGSPLVAQTVRQPLLSHYTGLGSYSLRHTDLFSLTVNPAALAQIKQASIGTYAERRFMLEAFNHSTVLLALPTGSGNFGLQGDYFGYRNFQETQLGLMYGRALGSKVDVGVKFNYYHLRIPGYLQTSTIHFETGLVVHFTDQLHGGFSVFNPVGGVLNKEVNEKIASVYRGGLGYEASEQFFISAEVVKEENKPVGVHAGLQYRPVQAIQIRAGVNTINTQPFLGVGVLMQQFRIDVTAAHHPQLGVSPGVLLIYQFKKPSR